MHSRFIKLGSWITLLLASVQLSGQLSSDPIPTTIKLWQGIAPGSENVNLQINVEERSTIPEIKNRSINQILEPELEVFLPQKSNGTAVLICPGGGYKYLSYDKEGVDIAKWFNTLGITAFVLKYRLPSEGHQNGKDVPLQDTQRALRMIRSGAVALEIDPDKIGVIGFSAGGHLASSLGTGYHRKVYKETDSIDNLSARPDFMILLYPVISMEPGITHKGSRERLIGKTPTDSTISAYTTYKHITAETPPSFLIHAKDDGAVPIANSTLFYDALIENKVPTEMHTFPIGGHGFGMRNLNGPVAEWPVLLEKWLNNQGLIK